MLRDQNRLHPHTSTNPWTNYAYSFWWDIQIFDISAFLDNFLAFGKLKVFENNLTWSVPQRLLSIRKGPTPMKGSPREASADLTKPFGLQEGGVPGWSAIVLGPSTLILVIRALPSGSKYHSEYFTICSTTCIKSI